MADYRIDDLARAAGMTVRNVRAYQDRGLLQAPRRQGRVALYGEAHLARLQLVAQLLGRGYSLGNIQELVAARDEGTGLGAVLGVVSELAREAPGTLLDRETYAARYGAEALGPDLAVAIALGLVEPQPDGLRLPFPDELAAGYELRALGVPMAAVVEELTAMRADMARVAQRVVALAARYVLVPLGQAPAPPPDLEALVRRLPAIAHVVARDELDRAMRDEAPRLVEAALRHEADAASLSALDTPLGEP